MNPATGGYHHRTVAAALHQAGGQWLDPQVGAGPDVPTGGIVTEYSTG